MIKSSINTIIQSSRNYGKPTKILEQVEKGIYSGSSVIRDWCDLYMKLTRTTKQFIRNELYKLCDGKDTSQIRHHE
jgi:hypothetical protein